MNGSYTILQLKTRDFKGVENTVSIKNNFWDLTMEDLYNAMEALALAAGYHPETVDEYFNDE